MANDFDPVAKIIEYWQFENNLTAGKAGNNLTASAGGVGYESGSPLEGSYSLDLENGSNQWAYRNDADLSAGFPLKSDDAIKKISLALWIKPESITTDHGLISKYNATGNKRSFSLNLYANSLDMLWGYNNGANYYAWDICSITAGQSYHIGIAIDGIAKTALARIYQVGGSAATYQTSFGNELSVSDNPFTVGNVSAAPTANDYDGLIDELVVADDVLSVVEFDAIRQGIYNQANPATLNLSLLMQQVNIAGDYIYQPFIVF